MSKQAELFQLPIDFQAEARAFALLEQLTSIRRMINDLSDEDQNLSIGSGWHDSTSGCYNTLLVLNNADALELLGVMMKTLSGKLQQANIKRIQAKKNCHE